MSAGKRDRRAALTATQVQALDILRSCRQRSGYYGIDAAALATALDTSENGAARTASSLVRRGLVVRFVGGVGRKRVHWQAKPEQVKPEPLDHDHGDARVRAAEAL